MRSCDHVSTWSYVSRQKPVAWAEVLRLWLLPWLLPPCPASSWGPSHHLSLALLLLVLLLLGGLAVEHLPTTRVAPPLPCKAPLLRRGKLLHSQYLWDGEFCKWGISVAWLIIDHGDLWEEKWKQCSSKLACCAQLLPHILPHFPECIAQSIFTYLNLAQLIWWCRFFFQKCPVLSPSKIPFFWVKLAFPQFLYSLSPCEPVWMRSASKHVEKNS